MNISTLDIIFIVLVILIVIRSYLRGFITEFTSLSALVFGIIAALYFYKNGADFIRNSFMPETEIFPEIISFVFLFISVFIIIKLIGKLLKDIIENIHFNGIDRFLGLLFGLVEGIAVVSLVLFLLKIQPFFAADALLEESSFAKTLLPLITGREILSIV